MLKRINFKRIFKLFAWLLSLTVLIASMSFVSMKKQSAVCTNVKILIPGADNFIEREEIDAILARNEGDLIGRNLEQINLGSLEDRIEANPYIASARVFADMNGVISIELKQYEPVLRVINAANQHFYIEETGRKIPVSSNFTANVLAANGKIMEYFSGAVDTLVTKTGRDLYKVALFIRRDTLWDAQFEQIYVTKANDIILIPRVGNQKVILGSADSLNVKMENLLAFYKKAMPKMGWDTYKTINIKYTNQVVCEKNVIDSSKAVRLDSDTTTNKIPSTTNSNNQLNKSI